MLKLKEKKSIQTQYQMMKLEKKSKEKNNRIGRKKRGNMKKSQAKHSRALKKALVPGPANHPKHSLMGHI